MFRSIARLSRVLPVLVLGAALAACAAGQSSGAAVPLEKTADAALGTPENPLTFTPTGCFITGGSGNLCLEDTPQNRSLMHTLEYKAEYACYKTAACGRLKDGPMQGQCGWQPTPELAACLKNPPALQ